MSEGIYMMDWWKGGHCSITIQRACEKSVGGPTSRYNSHVCVALIMMMVTVVVVVVVVVVGVILIHGTR